MEKTKFILVWITRIVLLTFLSGCALPVTRSLQSASCRHEINMWGNDMPQTTIMGKAMMGIKDDNPQVIIGMTKEEVKVIMGEPAKIIKYDSSEYWIYFIKGEWGSDIRWIIPPYIPVGRIHYKLFFEQERLKKILLKTMEYL